MSHCLLFIAPVNQNSAATITAYLNEIAIKGCSQLTLAISSQGGNVDLGVTIFNLLRAMPFPVVTHNIGSVNSIANVLFLAGAERLTNSSGTFMFHGIGFDSNPAERLEEKNLKEKLDTVQHGNGRLAQLVANHSNLALETCVELFKEQTTRDAVWAFNNGVAHRVEEFCVRDGWELKHLV